MDEGPIVTVELTRWEIDHLAQKQTCEALTYLGHQMMGNLRPPEIEISEKIQALAEKLSNARAA